MPLTESVVQESKIVHHERCDGKACEGAPAHECFLCPTMSEDYVQGTRHAVCDGARFQNAFEHKMVCGHFLCSGCWGAMHDSGRSLRCPACRFRYLETPEEREHFITVVSGALARGGDEELKAVLPQFYGAPGEASEAAAVVVADTPEVSDSEGEEEPAGAFLGGQALRAPAHVSAATASRTTTVALVGAAAPVAMPEHAQVAPRTPVSTTPLAGHPHMVAHRLEISVVVFAMAGQPAPTASSVLRGVHGNEGLAFSGISLSGVATLATDSAREHWRAERRAVELAETTARAAEARAIVAEVQLELRRARAARVVAANLEPEAKRRRLGSPGPEDVLDLSGAEVAPAPAGAAPPTPAGSPFSSPSTSTSAGRARTALPPNAGWRTRSSRGRMLQERAKAEQETNVAWAPIPHVASPPTPRVPAPASAAATAGGEWYDAVPEPLSRGVHCANWDEGCREIVEGGGPYCSEACRQLFM